MSAEMATQQEQGLPVGYDAAEAQKRATAWAKLGTGIYSSELRLQAKAQAAIMAVKIPTSIKEIAEAEQALKAIKAAYNELSDERKKITSRFDAKRTELMQIEDSVIPKQRELEAAMLNIKKEEQDRLATEKKKSDEVAFFTQSIKTQLAEVIARFEMGIHERVDIAYKFALEKGHTGNELTTYLQKVSDRVTAMDFVAVYAPPYVPQYLTDDEFDALKKEHWVIECASLVDDFNTQLKAKFEFFEIAVKNKAAALELAAKETADAAALIEEKKTNTQIAASMAGSAVSVSSAPAFKATKKSYKIEMPETEESAMKILQAYLANKAQCRTKSQIKNWFGFGVKNCITMLEKVKNEDNAFTVTGITFVEVEKL